MGLGDVWNRTLVYFGIAEDEEWDDEELTTTSEELERDYRRRERRERPPPAAAREADAGRSPTACPSRSPSRRAADAIVVLAPRPAPRRRRLGASQVRVHLVLPRSFNDAQQIADRFKDSVPVILNLQSADTELSKRLIDFASGLTYALDGSMQRVADKVFLLTPRNVEVSAEERARALDPRRLLQPGLTRRPAPRREEPRGLARECLPMGDTGVGSCCWPTRRRRSSASCPSSSASTSC